MYFQFINACVILLSTKMCLYYTELLFKKTSEVAGMRLEGQRIDRYNLLQLIGSGGMGEVYLAEDPRVEQQVAIKVVRDEVTPYPDPEASKETATLFLREVRAIAKLDHPNILPLFDYGEHLIGTLKITYIVMPFRPEGSLGVWVRQRGGVGGISLQQIAHFLDQATAALQHAHGHQIIHQDVKPSNFLLRSRKENPNYPDLFLADFGIARFYSATSNVSATIRGTPAYMAPEQWRGHPMFATDQYALAVMVYQLLTGRSPFQGGLEQIMYMHLNDRPPLPSTFNSHVPPAIEAVIMRALSKKPEERFPTISEFASAFQQAITQVGPFPNPITPLPLSQPSGELRAILAISEQEARAGTTRILTLPSGRRVSVPIQAGAYEGQVIRLEGQGEATNPAQPPGTLVITLAIDRTKGTASHPSIPETIAAERTYLTNRPAGDAGAVESNQGKAYLGTMPATPPSISGGISRGALTPSSSSFPSIRQDTQLRRGLSRGRAILLIILALLVIGGSVGIFFYITETNQMVTSHANATATAQAMASAAQAKTVATAQAKATATASVVATNPNPYPPRSGTLVLYDPLRDDSSGSGWDKGSKICAFIAGAYHVSATGVNHLNYCFAQATSFSNFAYEVQMKITRGDVGGMIFRADSVNKTYYSFFVDQNGYYGLFACNDKKGGCGKSLVSGKFSPAINQGLNKINLVAVVAMGTTITLYVNHQQLISVNDSTYNLGQIGLVASPGPNTSNPTEVVYSDVKVWSL
jgi:serine/threonine protein kinase